MENKYDELLIRGLTKLIDVEFSHVYEDEDLNYEFSEEYIRHKEKLIKSVGRPYWKFVNTIAKKVAVIIVTLIIAFSSLMTVGAFREKVVDFIYKIYKIYSDVTSDNDEKNLSGNHYTIFNIPTGYTYTFSNKYQRIISTYWGSVNSTYIMLTQTDTSNTNKFNSEHGELSEKIINNTPCLVCVDNNLYYCYWEFDGYRFELIYPLDLGEEFMSEVVGNLVEIDPEELEN